MNRQEEKRRNAYYTDPLALPPECDCLCPFRPCFNKYENKGSFSTGRGYTSYSSTFRAACGTRLSHGCPLWRGESEDKVDMLKALKWAHEQLSAEKRTPRTKAERCVRKRVLDVIGTVADRLESRQNGSSAGEWICTADRLPRNVPNTQAFILMWSSEWATWVHGMFTCQGEEKLPEWAVYNTSEDRFYDWCAAPEWWCEVKMPSDDRIGGAK